MILKPYQLSNLKEIKSKFFLLYGQNEGQKNDVVQQIIKTENKESVYRYEEDEILNNYNNFIAEISNKSFFDNKKIIIISRVTEKILALVEDLKEKKIEDIKIINLDASDVIRHPLVAKIIKAYENFNNN